MISAKNRGFLFQETKISAPQKNGFDLSHERKTTMRLGLLTTLDIMDTLPSDDFEIKQELLVRAQPSIAPFMHRMNIYTHWFYVPLRITWNGFEEMISRGNGKVKMTDAESYIPPVPPKISFSKLIELSTTFYDNGSDILRVTPRTANGFRIPYTTSELAADVEICLMPFIANALIYNEFYRDANLIDEINVDSIKDLNGNIDSLIDSDNTIRTAVRDILASHYRAWEKDYFTSSLSEPQRGPDVLLPLGDLKVDLPVQTDNINSVYQFDRLNQSTTAYTNAFGLIQSNRRKTADTNNYTFGTLFLDSQGNAKVQHTQPIIETGTISDSGPGIHGFSAVNNENATFGLHVHGNVDATASGLTVSRLRQALSLAKWFEKAARVGSRYVETIKGFFNSTVPDSRLQSPEYIIGFKQPFVVSEVLQTSESNDTPQGNMAGHTISVDDTQSFHYHCPEHGYLIAVSSILPRTSYSNGLPKMFSVNDFTDFPWPEFENIGEEPVLNKEIYAAPLLNSDGSKPTNPERVFGYQSRYANYKYIPDTSGGDFTINMRHWTLDREFGETPELSKDFIEARSSDRIFAVQSSEHPVIKRGDDLVGQDSFYLDAWIDVKAVRPLQLFSEPTI